MQFGPGQDPGGPERRLRGCGPVSRIPPAACNAWPPGSVLLLTCALGCVGQWRNTPVPPAAGVSACPSIPPAALLAFLERSVVGVSSDPLGEGNHRPGDQAGRAHPARSALRPGQRVLRVVAHSEVTAVEDRLRQLIRAAADPTVDRRSRGVLDALPPLWIPHLTAPRPPASRSSNDGGPPPRYARAAGQTHQGSPIAHQRSRTTQWSAEIAAAGFGLMRGRQPK
jgi:hypothetical protein